MGAPIGGSIENVTIDNQLFPVASDADATMSLGGYTNEIQPNGDKTARIIKTVVPWGITGLSLGVDDDAANQEFLQAIADGNEWVPITIRMASGVTYQGTGTVVDTLERSTQSATITAALGGQGVLTQQ